MNGINEHDRLSPGGITTDRTSKNSAYESEMKKLYEKFPSECRDCERRHFIGCIGCLSLNKLEEFNKIPRPKFEE